MAVTIHKLICDEGTFFILFDDTSDHFVSPPTRTPEEQMPYIQVYWPDETKPQTSFKRVHDITSRDLTLYQELIVTLISGESLSDADAIKLGKFADFIEYATHGYRPPETTLTEWSKILELTKHASKTFSGKKWDFDDVVEFAKLYAYLDAYLASIEPMTPREKVLNNTAQIACNKFTGRLLQAYAYHAQLIGDKIIPPQELIELYQSSDKETQAIITQAKQS